MLKRPNIIFIVADDLGYADLGCTGARDVHSNATDVSPRLDAMARSGMRFTRGYSNSAVCSPTRFALATGRWQYRLRGAAEEPIATGGTLINPLKDKVDVQLVGAYGKSTSENYGEVSLVLKVKMIANKNEISIGGNSNWPVMLIDEEGNVSEPRYLGWTPYSVSEGIYMKIILKDSSTFTNVKKSAKIIQKAQIALSLSYDEKGLLIMKNVPIQWDVQP